MRQLICLALLFSCSGAADAQPIVIDGVFDDWDAVPIAATDPAGDNSKAFDLTEVKAISRGTVVLIKWDTNASVNLQAGSNADGTIRIELGFESGQTLTVDTRSRIAYENGNTGNTVSWFAIDYTSLPTAALPVYETRIDVADYASPGEDVTINFSSSDSLATPITLTLDQPEQAPPSPMPGDLDRAPCTDFRIVNINTLQSGMTDNNQEDELGRILDAFDPEIICLQEEYDNSASTLKNVIEGIDPNDDGSSWNVYKEFDNVIASPFPVIGYVTGDSFGLAVVDLSDGGADPDRQPVLVVSVHTKCCGFAGDSNDDRRVASMLNLVGMIEDFNDGTLSGPLAPYAGAPAVIVGDWNHVGSDTPLQVVLSGLVGTEHWVMPGAGADHAATWRDLDGFGFMPGLLDLLVYDATALARRAGFVLDTSDLSAPTLAHYGLQSGDSGASDHRAIIADFEFGTGGPTDCLSPCGVDLNGDGVVDNGDIGAFIALFLAGDLAADFNGDGILDNGDIGAFINAFLAGC